MILKESGGGRERIWFLGECWLSKPWEKQKRQGTKYVAASVKRRDEFRRQEWRFVCCLGVFVPAVRFNMSHVHNPQHGQPCHCVGQRRRQDCHFEKMITKTKDSTLNYE